MKLRFIFLFLFALLLAPATVSGATETEKGGEVYEPDNLHNFNDWQIDPKEQNLAFDEKGRVTSGVLTYTCVGSYPIVLSCLDVTAQEGNCLLIAPADNGAWTLFGATSSGSLTGVYSVWCYWGGGKSTLSPLSEDGKSVFPLETGTNPDTSEVSNWIYGSWIGLENYEYCLDISTGSSPTSVYSFWTDIPVFQDRNSEACRNYILNGDYSGANNADEIEETKQAKEPKNSFENKNGPWLKMGNFDGSNLTIRPAVDAYCSWSYLPQNTEEFTDLTLDILYSYQLSYQIGPSAMVGKTEYYTASTSKPLKDCNYSYICHPTAVATNSNWCKKIEAGSLMFGGKMTESVGAAWIASANFGTEVAQVTGSFLTVTFKLKGKKNGDWVNGPAYIEKVDLLERTCTEVAGYADEEGNYTPDSNGKVTDENGNVTVQNDIDISGGGSGGGGSSSSSAQGGNSTSKATIGDITNTNTFKFPDKITIDLNVNGIEGGSGGGSSGSSEGSDKKWYDRLLDAIGSLIEFLTEVVTKLFEALGDLLTTFADSVGDFIQYLFEGFGLFKNDGGIGSLIQDNYSFVPSEVWRLVMFGIASVILVSIVNRFFK